MMESEQLYIEKKNYSAIDVAKFICALLVVCIHTQPLGDRLTGGGIS